MSEKKTPAKQKKSFSSILSLAAMVIAGALLGIFGAQAIEGMTGGSDALFFIYLIVMLVGLYAAFFLQIIAHEGGHLVFGLMSGYGFVSFNVLGFIWTKGADGKVHLGRMQLAGAGGQCLMAPPDYDDGRYPFTLYNLGGVLANVIFSLLCALLAWLIPVAPLRILLATQAVVGLSLAVMNGVPFTTEAIQNDGKNLLCIRRDAHARRAFWVQMAIAAATARGMRLKSMPDEWFQPFPEETMDNAIIASVAVLNTSRLMDELDFPAAESAIRTLLARKKGVLGLYRMAMTSDGAVCELIAGRPGDLTENLEQPEIKQMMKAMKTQPAIIRTHYAVALLKERDSEKARKLLEDFERAALRHPNPQEVAGEREILLAIQNTLLNGGQSA